MTDSAYERQKKRAASRQRRLSIDSRDIGPIPPVRDRDLRQECERSFKLFCEECFPERFTLAWSDDHLEMLSRTERVIRGSHQLAMAAPRGSGKSAVAITGGEWAQVIGRHPFVMLLGATSDKADELMDDIKTDYSTNPQLLSLWPEIFYPFHKLNGTGRLAKGQLHHGLRTHVVWEPRQVAMPWIPGSKAAGSLLRVRSLMSGDVRGSHFVTHLGETIRPTLAIPDDPQTDGSAHSPKQVNRRSDIITGTVGGLAGPGVRTAMIVPCTVVAADDVAERMTDPERFPELQGIKTKLVYAWGKDEAKWERYRELRARGLREHGHFEEATEFYRKHREAMDEGSRVGWAERYDRATEISALQHAENLRMDKRGTFGPEYQNEPQTDGGEKLEKPDKATLEDRIINLAAGVIPSRCTTLVGHIDVQQRSLWWTVAGFGAEMGGHVAKYGIFPRQKRAYITKHDKNLFSYQQLLRQTKPKASHTEALYNAIGLLVEELFTTVWQMDGGGTMELDRLGIDTGAWSDVVWRYLREGPYADRLVPVKGLPVKPTDVAIPDRPKKDKVQAGHHWLYSKPARRAKRQLYPDTGRWKKIVWDGLLTPMGGDAAITLHKGTAHQHQMIFDHWTAETAQPVTARGQTVNVFSEIPGRDNEFLDNLANAAAVASWRGVRTSEDAVAPKKKSAPMQFAA